MRALLYAAWDTLRVTDMPPTPPNEGEVLVKVEAAGICGSELEAVRKHSPRRTPPLILGHEFTGVVEQVGPGTDGWKVGAQVVANAVIADGTCSVCRRGLTNVCPNRQLFGMHRPGGFAQYVSVPVRALIPRPPGLEPGRAALTEPLANGVHVAGLLKDVSPKVAVVFGAGPIGLLAMQALKVAYSSKVAVVDRLGDRLEVAERLGADFVLQPERLSELQEWAGDDGIEASVDAVGAQPTKASSVAVVRPGGTAVWIGLHEDESTFPSYSLILPEKKILGSYACTQEELATALDWIAAGRVDVSSWVTTFTLEEADVAFDRMLHPGPMDVKAVLEIN